MPRNPWQKSGLKDDKMNRGGGAQPQLLARPSYQWSDIRRATCVSKPALRRATCQRAITQRAVTDGWASREISLTWLAGVDGSPARRRRLAARPCGMRRSTATGDLHEARPTNRADVSLSSEVETSQTAALRPL